MLLIEARGGFVFCRVLWRCYFDERMFWREFLGSR